MTYQEFIEYNRNKEQGPYIHIHHIIPRSIGGADDSDNLIELSWLTHYYAHYLLAKENPDNKKLVTDFKRKGDIDRWLRFCYSAKFHHEMTEETRAKLSKANKGKHLSEEHKQKLSEAMKGRKHTEESRQKMSEAAKNRKPMTEEHKQKISEKKKGKHFPKISEAMKGHILTEEHKNKISESRIGTHHSEETKRKISESMTPERRKAISEGLKGDKNPMYGKHPSEETRKKLSEARKAYWEKKKQSCSREE